VRILPWHSSAGVVWHLPGLFHEKFRGRCELTPALPVDPAAEKGVCGCLMLAASNDDFRELVARANIPLSSINDLICRTVYSAILDLGEWEEKTDVLHVFDKVKHNREMNEAAWREFVFSLPEAGGASAENIEYYAAKVKDAAARREMLAEANRMQARALDMETPVSLPKRRLESPFTIWKPSQFLTYVEPAGTHLILPAYMSKGSTDALIGQPGLGKSRLALWKAICQILGRPWCGLETSPEPVKWLFLGDENSISRWKEDLTHMFSILDAQEISKVDEFLRLPATHTADDNDFWLGDVRTQARMAATIEAEAPGAIVADPLGNMAPDDISKPGPMKEAIRLIQSIVRKSAPEAALSILHHARSGRANVAQGVGWDAGNFASGGKALLASARCVINLMPGSADDDTKLVMSCAKCNNAERFQTRGLVFNRDSFTYSEDPDFNLEGWLADVEGKARPGQSLCTVAEVTSAVADGYTTTKALVEHLTEACATSRKTVERVIRKAVDCEGIKPLTRGKFIIGRKSAKYLPTKA